MKTLKKVLLSTLAAMIVLSANACKKEPDKDIKVVFTNDIHCGIKDNIDISSLLKYYDDIDRTNNYTFLVDAGDFSQGESIGTFSKGEDMYELMDKLGYDVVVPGNHEFDYSIPVLLKNSIHLTGKMICCNFYDLKKNEPVFDPYKILNAGSKKIAFIGVTTPDTIKGTSPTYFEDSDENYIYGFCQENEGKDFFDVVQKNIDECKKQGADYIILLAHLGEVESASIFNSVELIRNVTGVDAIFDGHSHDKYNTIYKDKDGKDVVAAQTGTKLESFGVLTIDKAGNKKIDLIDKVDGIDEEADAIISYYLTKLENALSEVIVKDSKVELTTLDKETGKRRVRNGETNLANLCADALLEEAKGADIALMNGGGIRDNIAPGDITYSDAYKVFPFNNMLCVVEVTGQTLKDALEFGAMDYPEERGGFMHPAGFTYTIDAKVPSHVVVDEQNIFKSVDGEYRVKDIMIKGEPIDLDKKYKLAALSYHLKRYGDGCDMFRGSKLIIDDFEFDVNALVNYLKICDLNKYADPKGEGRITILR